MRRAGDASGGPAESGILHDDVDDVDDAHASDVSIFGSGAHLRAQDTRQTSDDGTEAGE